MYVTACHRILHLDADGLVFHADSSMQGAQEPLGRLLTGETSSPGYRCHRSCKCPGIQSKNCPHRFMLLQTPIRHILEYIDKAHRSLWVLLFNGNLLQQLPSGLSFMVLSGVIFVDLLLFSHSSRQSKCSRPGTAGCRVCLGVWRTVIVWWHLSLNLWLHFRMLQLRKSQTSILLWTSQTCLSRLLPSQGVKGLSSGQYNHWYSGYFHRGWYGLLICLALGRVINLRSVWVNRLLQLGCSQSG